MNLLGHARILVDTTRRMRAILAEPVLSEFVEFVGRSELAADLDSLDRIARSMREDVDLYLKQR